MMSDPARPIDPDDEEAAETALLIAAVAEADADPRVVPHEEVRLWLLELASGNFSAPRPIARIM